MKKITIYNDGTPKATTSKVFDCEIKKELMREYTAGFSIVNNNPILPFVNPDSVVAIDGQMFDAVGIDTESGANNFTAISLEHVSYRLNSYPIPQNYSFVGNVSQIANAILTTSGANEQFTVGDCADKGTVSFSMENDSDVTAKDAFLSMKKLGIEVEYDNFTVKFPERIGTDTAKTIRFGTDLVSFKRRWEKDNGWTYDVNIANTTNADGTRKYNLGDSVIVDDSFVGDSVSRRIVAIKECDDPTKNSITLGVFIRDNASTQIETDETANSAYQAAANSIQQGKNYSNVSITHEDGVKAINLANDLRVVMNVNDCFAVQVKQSDGTWKSVTTAEFWGILTSRLTTQDAKDKFYATIGNIGGNNLGLKLVSIQNGVESTVLEIGQLDGAGNPVIKSKDPIVIQAGENCAISTADSAGNIKQILNTAGVTGTFQVTDYSGTYRSLRILHGIITEVN